MSDHLDDPAPRKGAQQVPQAPPAPDRTAPEAPIQQVARWRALLSDVVSVRNVALLLALALIGATALFGGWDSATQGAEHGGLVVVGAETVEIAPFKITFKKCKVGTELAPFASKAAGVRYYFVTADVTNTADEPVWSDYFGQMFEPLYEGRAVKSPFSDKLKVPPATVTRLDLERGVGSYQPGLTYPVVIHWPQDTASPELKTIEIDLTPREWRTVMVTGGEDWMSAAAPTKRLSLPVEPMGEA